MFRGPGFFSSDMYLTKQIPLREKLAMRLEAQFFDVFNHANFGLPSMVLAGIPGKSFYADRIWSAHVHHISTNWVAWRGLGWR
jgi:hypothetical protein